MRHLLILGSTGSIGRQALEVLPAVPELRLVGLAAGRDAAGVVEQARRARRARRVPARRGRGGAGRGAGAGARGARRRSRDPRAHLRAPPSAPPPRVRR